MEYLRTQQLILFMVCVLAENHLARRFNEKNGGQLIHEKAIKLGEQDYKEAAYIFGKKNNFS